MRNRHVPLAIAAIMLLTVFPRASAAVDEPDLDISERQKTLCERTKCRFLLCKNRQSALLGAPLKPFLPLICRLGQDIEAIRATGEALVVVGRKRIPISKWRPEGLSPNFPKTYISTRVIKGKRRMSGIVRSAARGNQNKFIDKMCFILPIKSYEKVGPKGTVLVKNNSPKDCLLFFASAPDIVVQAQWFSGDDMDLFVKTPGRETISNQMRNATCGLLIKDENVDTCMVTDSGTENVKFSFRCAKKGKYCATLKHSRNCKMGPTKWEIRVIIRGRLIKVVKGKSNKNGGAKVGQTCFTLTQATISQGSKTLKQERSF